MYYKKTTNLKTRKTFISLELLIDKLNIEFPIRNKLYSRITIHNDRNLF